MGRAKNKPKRDALMLPYQRAWILDESRLKIAEKSRQIGFSWCSSYGAVRRRGLSGAQLDTWVSSRDELQAKLFLEDCEKFAELLQLGAENLGESLIDDVGSSFSLRFSNGLRINSMSSNPDAQAGKRGERILDEFALHPNPKKLYSIAYPGITWGGSLEIFSSHRGSKNYFNELIQEIKDGGNPKKFSHHKITLEDALNQGFLYKLQAKLPNDDERQGMDEQEYFDFIRAGCPDEETFLQEYMCSPADDAGAFLPYEIIDGCVYPAGDNWEWTLQQAQASSSRLWGGTDIGRERDLTSFTMLEQIGESFFTRKRIDLSKTPFTEQERILYPWFSVCDRVCIDASGHGSQFAERAQEQLGKYRVERIVFSGPIKEALAYPMKSTFEDRRIYIPNESELIADLHKVRRETTAAGNIRLDATRDKGGHADRFWSVALAIHAESTAIEKPTLPKAFETRVASVRRTRKMRSVVG